MYYLLKDKCPSIALDQIQIGGGCGVCCQKISEAMEALSTVDDVLISNQIVSEDKLSIIIRMNKLPNKTISLCVDNLQVIQNLEKLLQKEDSVKKLNLLVEYNVGQNRCGVESNEEVLRLINEINSSSHLNFKGLQCYHGSNQHINLYEERELATMKVVEKTKNLLDYLKNNGIE